MLYPLGNGIRRPRRRASAFAMRSMSESLILRRYMRLDMDPRCMSHCMYMPDDMYFIERSSHDGEREHGMDAVAARLAPHRRLPGRPVVRCRIRGGGAV